MTDEALIGWLQSVDGRLSEVSTKLDAKADKADLQPLFRRVGAIERRQSNDEAKALTIEGIRTKATAGRQWAVGLLVLIASGLVGALVSAIR